MTIQMSFVCTAIRALTLSAGLAALAATLAPTPAVAVAVGLPGAPTPSFSLRGNIGLGYSYRQLDGKNAAGDPLLDSVKRFLIVGKVSMLPLEWLEIGGTILGADGKRTLTNYKGELGIGGGGFVNFHPLRQEDFDINLTLGGGVEVIRNHGTAPSTDATQYAAGQRIRADLKERDYFAYALVSRSMKTWNFYGGLLWNLADVRQQHVLIGNPKLAKVNGRSQFGMVVGVDYFITPLVYFGLEGQNFNQDQILGSIGLLVAPDGD